MEISILSGSWNLGSGRGSGCTTSACNGEGDVNGPNAVTGNHSLVNLDWSINGGLSQALNLASGTPLTVIFGSGAFRDGPAE